MDLVNMKTEFSTTLKINQGSFNANEEKIIRLELDLKGKCEQNKELAAKVAEMEKNSKSSAAKRVSFNRLILSMSNNLLF